MKYLFEHPTYSLYNHQERIDCFRDNTTNPSVLENRYWKRMEFCSLASDEQSNTYLYLEENTHVDDCSSLTTITSNLPPEYHDYSYSDEESSTSSQSYLIGLMPVKSSPMTQQTLSNDHLVNQSSEQHNTIRSSVDNVSLNSSMTSSIPFLGKQEEDDHDDEEDEYDIIVNSRRRTHAQLTMNHHDNEIEEEELIESTKLYDNGQYDGTPSDESQQSDDLRYSSTALPVSCVSDNLTHNLRQEAISLTKVRCKPRQSWFNTSPDHLQSTHQVDGTNRIRSSPLLKTNINGIRMKHSLDSNQNENMNVQAHSYDFLQLNCDHHTMKTNEAIVSPLLKTNNTFDKDASSTSSKRKNFYLIHHQSSLVPIKNYFNQTLNSNIERIEMDEQDSILEIVDGAINVVPKEKIMYIESDEEEEEEEDQRDSPKREKRSSSIASSISTPSISDHVPEREAISSTSSSRLSSNKEQVQEPFILLRDIPSKSSSSSPSSPLPPPSQTEKSVDLLDLFSTPPVPSSQSNGHEKFSKNLLDDSLSSVSSSYEHNSESSDHVKVRSSSPVKEQTPHLSPSASIADDLLAVNDDKAQVDYPIPKSEPPPAAKPINKARINEFASLLSSAVHLTPPTATKKTEPSKVLSATSPVRSEEQSYSSIQSAPTDRDERESYHTVKSNLPSDPEQTKKSIDARYNEKIDDRKNIQINTSNIKALFEQKISDTNRAIAQSHEQLTHLAENKQQQQQHKRVPISYVAGKRNLPLNPQITNRRQSFQDSPNMEKYSDHIEGTKDVVIEEKKPAHIPHVTQAYGGARRNNTEQIVRPGVESLTTSPVNIPNGYYSESLIAREIRETKEKEEELRQQRKKCGLPEENSSSSNMTVNNNTVKSESSAKQPMKSDSFLANLDFFTTKSNESNVSRRSTVSIQNLVYDSQGPSSHEERKPSFTPLSPRSNENAVPIIRTTSTNSYIHRSSSNQNLLSAQNANNVIQREIEAIRAKEAELRQLGRIQNTSDDHADPRKYQEVVSPIPKSQSTHVFAAAKPRRETERINKPMTATSNGILKPKPMNASSSMSSIRGKFPTPNPTAPIVSSANKAVDYSKLSSSDRLELEKREAQEREQELRKQRNSLTGATLSVNSTMNGDSGNASQDEHEEDQEHYFEKLQRFKRTENEKAQAPLVRPTKKLNLSQKWEQMIANKANNTGADNDEDKF